MNYDIIPVSRRVPDDVSPEDYSFVIRRAAILEYVGGMRDPSTLTQDELAEHFGVSQNTISVDMRAIAEAHDMGEGADRWYPDQADRDAAEEAPEPEVTA